ncbi:hypothetical protein Leryth_021775, partial [Lithospermum erythrorhizon]
LHFPKLPKNGFNSNNKFYNPFEENRKVHFRVPSVTIDDVHAIEDVHDAKKEQVVNELRETLVDRDLLPARLDDYHTLLRFLKARDFDIEKTVQMWE